MVKNMKIETNVVMKYTKIYKKKKSCYLIFEKQKNGSHIPPLKGKIFSLIYIYIYIDIY